MPPSSHDWITRLRQLAGSEQRLHVLAVLAAHPEPMFHRQIMDALAQRGYHVHPTGLGKMLRELEAFGFISGDLPPKLRHGRTVRYTLAHHEVAAVLAEALSALTPE